MIRTTPRTRTSPALTAILLVLAIAYAVPVCGQHVVKHPSTRYFQDASGTPFFLTGYYGWAAVADGYYIDNWARYAVMMTDGAPYKINYIRISLGVARFTNPPDGSGNATPTPFLYVYSGGAWKADLNQWDSVFWNGLKDQCELAAENNIIVHVALFDGVELRYQDGEDYGYLNSWWKPSNQTSAFYPNPDFNSNNQIDDSGEFYQLANFNNNTGIGYYQRRLIDKAASELAGYDNVFFEIGNELLGSDTAWNTAVINYIKTKTAKAITQNNNGGDYNRGLGLDGWSQHNADTPTQVKSNVAAIVGKGYPAWEDPDGPALSDWDVSADDLRRAAWYSFAGGAAGWGGFTVDYWMDGRGLWTPTVTYYRNLQTFIENSQVRFWDMAPQHSLVSNNSENSCLVNPGAEYVAYVLNDATVDINLSEVSGNATYRIYDPRTASWSSQQSVAGGAWRTFSKPGGADDWVVHVVGTSPFCRADGFLYPNGALVGNGGWIGSAPASRMEVIDTHIKLSGGAGGYDAIKYVSCGDPGTGYIWVECKVHNGTGGRTIWNLWINDSQGRNLARWYGTANTARGRIGNTGNVTAEYGLTGGWDTIAVKINPYNNTSQFFFNGASIGTLSHASESAGDAVGQLRLESLDNWEAVGHFLYFDDLRIGEEAPDTTPPAPVTNLSATAASGQITLNWTNPSQDFAGTKVLVKTTGYPTGPTDGTVIYDSSGTSVTHSGLSHGVTYYYAAFAHDAVPNYATAATTTGVPYYLRESFPYANGALVGNGGWTGNATAARIEVTNQTIRLSGGAGGYYALRTVSCSANPSGYIWQRCLITGGTGGRTIWNLWINDSSGRNMARWYGTAWTARGRIGETASVTATQNLTGNWDEIAVRINPAANTSEFFFNGQSIGTLSHASQNAGDVVAQLKFEALDNWEAVGHFLYFDELRLGGN